MRFGVLGPLEVWTADGTPVRVPELKVRALLADLLLHRGRPVRAARLIDDVWADALPANPPGVLRAKLSQLRRVLEEADPDGRDLLVRRPTGYLLDVPADAVDAHRFQAMLARARGSGDPRVRADLLAGALALWRGDALAEFADAEFARPAIASLEEQRLTALEDLAEARLALGEHDVLVGELAELVDRHPLRERFRAVQMRALYRSGRQSEALAAYADLRERLRDELGLDPGPELIALHQAILEQDPALSAAPPRTNLPAPLTELVGRSQELAEVRAALRADRLVTLTGPGGVGKTRLALAAAAGLTGSFPDGIWLIDLAGNPATPIAETVAAVLGIRDEATPGSLARALSGKRMLLILDNCEQVIEPLSAFARVQLEAAPRLRVLATSREPLGVPGERLLAVPPLDQSSAERLFLARAAAAAPGLVRTADNAAAITTICARLDGLPLALELAAIRVRTLGVAELADRLDDRFRLLAARSRGTPPRQQTLRSMIDWSWDLLTEPERTVLRRLAVHADGCTLEAAEAVCAADDSAAARADILDLLDRLVNRSLVVAVHDAAGPRYRLLESVAAYCVERLREADELDLVRLRHARYYTELAERADPRLRGPEQRHWLGRLDTETANLRGALETAIRQADAALSLRLVGALAWYWQLRGRLSEARRSMDAALAIGDPAPTAAWAKAVARRAGFALMMRDEADPPAQIRTALDAYEHIADPAGSAMARWILASTLHGFGDASTGEKLLDEALATFRALDDRWGAAAALSTRAWYAQARGDMSGLERDAEQSHALFDELGDQWGKSLAAQNLGALARLSGDYARATRLYRTALRVTGGLGLWTDMPFTLCELARIALLTGDPAQARELYQQARQLAVEHSVKLGEINALVGLGLVAHREGDLQRAESLLHSVLDWHRDMGYEPEMAAELIAELDATPS